MNIYLCNEAFPLFKPLSHVHAISCSQQRGARITTQYHSGETRMRGAGKQFLLWPIGRLAGRQGLGRAMHSKLGRSILSQHREIPTPSSCHGNKLFAPSLAGA